MKHWPVPNSYSKKVPIEGNPGSFWEDRSDRRHCGIDIYAPAGSKVISIADGIVLESGIFTTPEKVPYWNETKFVLIKNQDDIICKYAELKDVAVKTNDIVKTGQLIGYIGSVLDFKKINEKSPKYIQKIKSENKSSMLHFELYTSKPKETKKYLGGNWFGSKKPSYLVNPNLILSSTMRSSYCQENLE